MLAALRMPLLPMAYAATESNWFAPGPILLMQGGTSSMRRGAKRICTASTAIEIVLAALLAALTACGPPMRQFDLMNQALTCEQANDATLRALESMYFKISEFEPAAAGRPGKVRGKRKATVGFQNVRVNITCRNGGADVDASEEGDFFGVSDFKQTFYLHFTAAIAEVAAGGAPGRDRGPRSTTGLQVLIEPVDGLNAKIDFDLDPTAAGVLPVRITINNVTARRYTFDPNEVVLLRTDGARVSPLSVAEAAQRIAAAEAKHRTAAGGAVVDSPEAARRLEQKVLSSHAVAGKQTLKGYLFYPVGQYTKGRLSLEDVESEESEGFVVDM